MERQTTSTAIERERVFVSLSRLLDDTYNHLADTNALYISTHAPIRGADARSYAAHALFERHYTEMVMTIDLLIRRMREAGLPGAAGATTPSRSSALARASHTVDTNTLIERLLENQTGLLEHARTVYTQVVSSQDLKTAALLAARIRIHEATARELAGLHQDTAAPVEKQPRLRAAS